MQKLGFGKNKKTFALIAIIILIPVFIGLFAFYQNKTQKDTAVLGDTQVNEIMAKVGKLMDVPSEAPTIATVSDVSKLTSQEFFKKAQNGDKVIIFPKAQKAILYRPATDKIIEVAFYNPTSTNQSAVSTPTPTKAMSLNELIGKPSASPAPSQSLSPNPTSALTPSPSAVSPTPGQ